MGVQPRKSRDGLGPDSLHAVHDAVEGGVGDHDRAGLDGGQLFHERGGAERVLQARDDLQGEVAALAQHLVLGGQCDREIGAQLPLVHDTELPHHAKEHELQDSAVAFTQAVLRCRGG